MKHSIRFVACVTVTILTNACWGQEVFDPTLTTQTWVTGLNQPTGAVIPNARGDFFVIEKATGKVQHVRDRRVRRTLLDLPVANDNEEGLLGIALSPTYAQDNFVYLYYTASTADGGAPTGHQIVRYQYDGEKLVFKKRLKTLPATPGPNHNGGKITFGPDGKLYAVIGDLNRNEVTSNYNNRTVSRTGGVLRLEPWGAAPTDNPFYSASRIGTPEEALNDFYAYGVRNSFGMDFDPVTGNLWDSENGRTEYDEINLVKPGFNSGWERIMGPASRAGGVPNNLVSLGAKAQYSDPEMSWLASIAPTDVLFFPNGRLGNDYRGDLFVGTLRGGKILHFELNRTRDGFVLPAALGDLVADGTSTNRFLESESLMFGQEFGTITDLLPGPGGMFVLSITGQMYRITTSGLSASSFETQSFAGVLPEPAVLMSISSFGWLLLRRKRPI